MMRGPDAHQQRFAQLAWHFNCHIASLAHPSWLIHPQQASDKAWSAHLLARAFEPTLGAGHRVAAIAPGSAGWFDTKTAGGARCEQSTPRQFAGAMERGDVGGCHRL